MRNALPRLSRVAAGSILLLVARAGLPAIAATDTVDPARQRAVIELVRGQIGPAAAQQPSYMGSEICLVCHPSTAGWRHSLHATMHAVVPDDANAGDPALGIIFDGNRNGVDDFKEGLDFNKISSAFDAYKPNAPVLSFAAGERYPYRVKIGEITYKVGIKEGGFYQQRLIVRIPAVDGPIGGLTGSLYMLPFAYSPRYQVYATYNPDKWWASGGVPKIVPGMTVAQIAGIGRSWTKACIGCHVTGFKVWKAAGEWVGNGPVAVVHQPEDRHYVDLDGDGRKEFLGVGCESCHGPGSLHILGGVDRTKIINPKNLTKQQQVWLCASCHTRGLSLPDKQHDYPYDELADHGYVIGEDIWSYLEDEAGRWPDGKTPTKGEQQFQSHEASKHYTNAGGIVTCTECHDVHSAERKLPRATRNGIATSFTNDTLCLSCHASREPFSGISVAQVGAYAQNLSQIATAVSAHSKHAYKPDATFGLSNCIACHMPRTAKRDHAYDESSHTMEAIPPEKTLSFQPAGGMPSSCAASCHGGRPLNFWTAFTNDDFAKWNETSDVKTAEILKRYFGPGGLWWNTTSPKPATAPAASPREGRSD